MDIASTKHLRLLSGRAHKPLAAAVAKHLDIKLSEAKLTEFANGEISCRLDESVRGADVFVMQTHTRPVNDAIMEQAIMIDAAKRASAKRITAVCPFFGYARQDRKAAGREPITAKLIVDILTTAGADRILSLDLHTGQIQGFFDGPFDHLTALPVLQTYLQQKFDHDLVVVSPDAGRVKTAELYAKHLGVEIAIVYKRRSKTKANTVEALDVIGEVEGRRCVLIDDMIDTAGTLVAAAEQLRDHGAGEVYAMATHGVLSAPAIERLEASPIKKLLITDSLPLRDDQRSQKIEVVSVAGLLAGGIQAIFQDTSVSDLFGGENQL